MLSSYSLKPELNFPPLSAIFCGAYSGYIMPYEYSDRLFLWLVHLSYVTVWIFKFTQITKFQTIRVTLSWSILVLIFMRQLENGRQNVLDCEVYLSSLAFRLRISTVHWKNRAITFFGVCFWDLVKFKGVPLGSYYQVWAIRLGVLLWNDLGVLTFNKPQGQAPFYRPRILQQQ